MSSRWLTRWLTPTSGSGTAERPGTYSVLRVLRPVGSSILLNKHRGLELARPWCNNRRTTRRLTVATCGRTKRESSSGSVLVDQGMPWVGQAGARGLGQLTGSVKVPGHSHSLSSGRLLSSLAVSSIWSGSCLSRPVLHVWPFVESRRTANRGDLQPEVSRGTLDCTDHSAQAGQRWSRGVPRFLPPT